MTSDSIFHRNRTSVVAVVVAIAATALPAPLDAATPHDKQKARELFRQGQAQYRVGNFETALANFKEALKLVNAPSVILNLAQCHRQLKNTDTALFFYKLYLTEWRRKHPDKKSPFYDEVHRHIANLEKAKQTAKVDQGSKRSGSKHNELAPPVKPATGPGRLRLVGVPGQAVVVVDGRSRGRAPLGSPLELAAGQHSIEVKAAGYSKWTKQLQISAGENTVYVSLQQAAQRRSRLWLWSGIGAGALAVGAGALAVAYNISANEQDTQPAYESDRNVGIAAYVVTGVAAAASAACLGVHLFSGEREAPAAAAMVAPVTGGIVVTGAGAF